MFYIFSQTTNKCIMRCSARPNMDDLASRNLFAVESEINYPASLTILYDQDTETIFCIEQGTEPTSYAMAMEKAQYALQKAQERAPKSVVYHSVSYQTDDASIQKLMLAQFLTPPIYWISENNAIQSLTAADISAILSLAAQNNSAIALYFREIKNSLTQVKSKYEGMQITESEAIDLLNGIIQELEETYTA